MIDIKNLFIATDEFAFIITLSVIIVHYHKESPDSSTISILRT